MKTLNEFIPEGYEIDKKKSTLDNIVLKQVDKLPTYSQICDVLYKKYQPYVNDPYHRDAITKINKGISPIESNEYVFFSLKDLERILALRKLINVAKYLNNGTEPNYNNSSEEKYYIYWDSVEQELDISSTYYEIDESVYFRTEESAQSAIEILGEDTIKTALGL